MNSKLFPAMKYVTTHWTHDLNLTHLKCSDYDKGFIWMSNIHLIGPVSGQSAALSEFLSEFIANRISENRTLLVLLGRWTTFSVRFVKIIIVKWFIVICLELYSKIIELLYVERNISWNLDELAITVSLCLSLILAYWRWYLNLFYKHREMYRRRSYRYLFHLRKGANHWKGL